MLRDRCPVVCLSVCLSVCNVGVLWPIGWLDQDASWYGGRPWTSRHCVTDGDPASSWERGTAALPPLLKKPGLDTEDMSN